MCWSDLFTSTASINGLIFSFQINDADPANQMMNGINSLWTTLTVLLRVSTAGSRSWLPASCYARVHLRWNMLRLLLSSQRHPAEALWADLVQDKAPEDFPMHI